MPVVFGSLERWFRLHKEDFHEIVLADGEGVTNINSSLLAWIAEKMPHRSIVILEGSELRSCWARPIPPGQRRMYGLGVDSAYDGEFTMRSFGFRDPETRFRCSSWRYQEWLDRFNRIQTGTGLPRDGAPFRWLLCDAGLFWLRGMYRGMPQKTYGGAPCFDDWWIVRRRFPSLHIGDDEVFLMGTCRVDRWGTSRMEMASYKQIDGDVGYDLKGFDCADRHMGRARQALALPDDAVVMFGRH